VREATRMLLKSDGITSRPLPSLVEALAHAAKHPRWICW